MACRTSDFQYDGPSTACFSTGDNLNDVLRALCTATQDIRTIINNLTTRITTLENDVSYTGEIIYDGVAGCWAAGSSLNTILQDICTRFTDLTNRVTQTETDIRWIRDNCCTSSGTIPIGNADDVATDTDPGWYQVYSGGKLTERPLIPDLSVDEQARVSTPLGSITSVQELFDRTAIRLKELTRWTQLQEQSIGSLLAWKDALPTTLTRSATVSSVLSAPSLAPITLLNNDGADPWELSLQNVVDGTPYRRVFKALGNQPIVLSTSTDVINMRPGDSVELVWDQGAGKWQLLTNVSASALPAGEQFQTLVHDGTSWVPNDVLRVDISGTTADAPVFVKGVNRATNTVFLAYNRTGISIMDFDAPEGHYAGLGFNQIWTDAGVRPLTPGPTASIWTDPQTHGLFFWGSVPSRIDEGLIAAITPYGILYPVKEHRSLWTNPGAFIDAEATISSGPSGGSIPILPPGGDEGPSNEAIGTRAIFGMWYGGSGSPSGAWGARIVCGALYYDNDWIGSVIRFDTRGRVLETGEYSSVFINHRGQVLIGYTFPTGGVVVNPGAMLVVKSPEGFDSLVLETPYTPSSSNDPNGRVGAICWDDDYIYVKTAAGWKRAALLAIL